MNLDTTLREKFKAFLKEAYLDDGGWNDSDKDSVVDFFLFHFHQLINEKREAVEALPTYYSEQDPYGNEPLLDKDDVLSILKD